MSAPGFDLDIVASATKAQRAAADPTACVFVEANAGSGKTRVLVDRVARLLLTGTRPDRILCVTFTKAAAGEMQSRLFRKLGNWSTLEDADLHKELRSLTGGEGSQDLALARRLFARALETPGGLKIQTLHAFCEGLLRRFPLEAGLSPGFEVQDDAQADSLKTRCLDQLYDAARDQPDGLLAEAIETVLSFSGPAGMDQLAGFAFSKRHELGRALENAGSAQNLADRASEALGVNPEDDEDAALDHAWMETRVDDLEAALSGLQAGSSKTEVKSAIALESVLEAGERDAAEATREYLDFLLTQKDQRVKQPRFLYGKKTGETYKILTTLWGEDGSERHRIESEVLPQLAACRANEATRAGLWLAAELITAYENGLERRRRVDFSDLIERAAALLNDAQSRTWTLYKLDQGLDHILVDEAQDTAPQQWSVINALTEEIFAGDGARSAQHASDVRTVFCVGDEKQSIYSFQNADPAEFLRQRLKLEADADGAGITFASPGLDVSFRSCAEVLDSVDAAFSAEAAFLTAPERKTLEDSLETKFLMAVPETGAQRDSLPFHRYDGHRAARANAPGCVEIWPAVPKPEKPDSDTLDILPADAERKDSARNQLAEAVASEIARILKDGDGVWQEDAPAWYRRAATPNDILVLVRKRSGLFEEIIRRLKHKHVPVAGADRMRLREQLIVEDLLSLGRWALLPEDDLSLAEVLKCAFFQQAGSCAPEIDDAALIDLTENAKGRLWEALRSSEDPRFAEARMALEAVRARVEIDAPYSFFARFLNAASATGESRLKRVYARLGEEARDPVEEFLSRALAHERDGAPSLARFVHEISQDDGQIKREMEAGRGEVRVMTVHGAKGLEAPIVFLPDTTQTPRDRSGGLYAHSETGLIWSPSAYAPADLAKALKERAELDEDGEYNRLLYVAMTRARDRLIVCGHTHGNGGRVDPGSWFERANLTFSGEGWAEIPTPLDAQAEENGWPRMAGRRFGSDPEPVTRAEDTPVRETQMPGWLSQPPPAEPAGALMAAPSRLLGEDQGGFEPPTLSPLSEDGPDRFRRGSLIHKLLQTLPDVAPDRRAASARKYLEHQDDLKPDAREEIARETLQVLNDERFAALFGPGSRAEVSVSGHASALPDGLVINGQIDRLVITDHEVLIIDYKTNRPPPLNVQDVSPTYIAQMAAYRALLQDIQPDKPVRCALLWTDGPRLMEIPGTAMDDVLNKAPKALGP